MSKFNDRTGEKNITKFGVMSEIIKYKSARDVTVLLETGEVLNTTYDNFKKGKIGSFEYYKHKYEGMINTNNQKLKMTIIKYNSAHDIDVMFEDGTVMHKRTVGEFKNGSIENKNYNSSQACDRTGETNLNKNGTKMEIIKYKNNKNVLVKFLDDFGYETNTDYCSFKNGSVFNPYDKTNFGVGYIGVGIYNFTENNKETLAYRHWYAMLDRCYSKDINNLNPYYDVEVCKDWHNFQNFAKWFYDNYYEIEGEDMQLDKDILVKGNKIYSSETCVFVPRSINCLFIKSKSKKGEFPIGVSYDKNRNKYQAGLSMYGRRIALGRFDTPEEAFLTYKKAKEEYIKEVANNYKSLIPEKLYVTMINYSVDIDD